MRYGIFSDVHSNLEALQAVLDAYKDEAIDRYLCVGDVVGYAANPNECVARVRDVAGVIVAGNHDWAAAGMFSEEYFNPVAKAALSWTKERLEKDSWEFLQSLALVYQNEDLTMVHGTLEGPENFDYMIDAYAARETFRILKTQVCFVGHSHIVGIFVIDPAGRVRYGEPHRVDLKENHSYIVNVGSVGQPRDHNPHAACCIFDTEKKQVQIKRVEYDVPAARGKIIEAGLPQRLGDRLLSGR